MNSTQKTIGFLRSLTADGLLSGDEMLSLATFLDSNKPCRSSWPGNLLAPMLGSALDDGELIDEEMEILASTILSIEQEWSGTHPVPGNEGSPRTNSLKSSTAAMPALELTFEMPAGAEDLRYTINLRQHTCTCPEWRQRQIWPAAHPGRCCKHVAHAFAQTGKAFAPWFQALLNDCFLRGRGTDPVDDWLLLTPGKAKPALVSGGPGEWCSVFAPETTGYEKYAFNRLDRRWSFGTAPSMSRQIEHAIREHF
jgi:hypothetical protein